MKKNSGFTLIEMAMVLLVITLIISGIAGGVSLIKSAEQRAIMREFEEYRTAVNSFKTAYNALPGDLRDARILTTLNSAAFAGNDNGRIEYNQNEGLFAWRHLSQAGMVDGSYDGAASAVEVTNLPRKTFVGDNAPASKSEASIGYYLNFTEFHNGFNREYNMIILGANYNEVSADPLVATGGSNAGAIPSEKAQSMDIKYDDGVPSSGNFLARDGLDPANTGNCATNVVNATYIITEENIETKNCLVAYILFK